MISCGSAEVLTANVWYRCPSPGYLGERFASEFAPTVLAIRKFKIQVVRVCSRLALLSPLSNVDSFAYSALQNDDHRFFKPNRTGFFCICVTCKERLVHHRLAEIVCPPSTLPNTSGISAEGTSHGTLLACERGAE